MSVVVENLSKLYGTQRALDQVSFEAVPGEILGFLGPNGAGKSTTMKIITCFIPQSGGQVKVCGFDTAASPMEVTKRIGYLPENNPLYMDMYVREFLEFMAGLHKLGSSTAKRVDEMIEVTGLTNERKKKIGQLSKGYKQRVGIAQAMLPDPQVLILDEPTSGLDPNQLVEIRSLIRELGKNKTLIFSSHIMQEVQAIADRIVIINKGKIVANDPAAVLQQKMQNEVTVVAQFKEVVDANTLRSINGVKSVSAQPDGSWRLSGGNTTDLREQVFHFARQKNLTLLTLYKETFTLEEVFKQLTAKGS